MSEREPWVVRHLYTATDPDFRPYLIEMKSLLRRAEQAQWISEIREYPIRTKTDIATGLEDSDPGELLIVDLHGAADEQGAWIGPTDDDDEQYFNLNESPPGSRSPAAVVLTNCEGAKQAFRNELQRINTRPFALVGHFESAWMTDHAPVKLVTAILDKADGGDERAAFTAAHNFINGHSPTGWVPEQVKPHPRQSNPEGRGAR